MCLLLFYNFVAIILQHSGVPLKIKRLARDPKRFIWAVSIAQSRCINMQTRIGALVQDANMLIPYAGKLLDNKHKVVFIYHVLQLLCFWIRINVTELLATFSLELKAEMPQNASRD